MTTVTKNWQKKKTTTVDSFATIALTVKTVTKSCNY